MSDEELLGGSSYMSESYVLSPVEALLECNIKVRKEKQKEYMYLLSLLDLVKLLKKVISSSRRKPRKRVNQGKSLSPDSSLLLQSRSLLEEEKEAVYSRIQKHLIRKSKVNISVEDPEWRLFSREAGIPIKECMSLWYSPSNPYYLTGKYSRKEDEEILKAGGSWDPLIKRVKRSPASIFIRHKELLKKEPISKWTEEEDHLLSSLVEEEGPGNWIKVAEHFPKKTPRQCMYRYMRALSPDIRKGKWTKEEDESLLRAVEAHGIGNWKKIKEHTPGRSDFQCRERFLYTLDPRINMDPWSQQEEDKLLQIADNSDKKDWKAISKHFPSRNKRQCQIRYYQIKRKRKTTIDQ